MSRSAEGTCRSCRARVAWCRTPAGKRIPLDAAPTADGEFVALRQGRGDYLAEKFQPLRHVEEKRYACHFGTCAAVKRARRLKKGGNSTVPPRQEGQGSLL